MWPVCGEKGTDVQPFIYQLKQEGEFPSATEIKNSLICEKSPIKEYDEISPPRNSGLNEKYLSAPLYKYFSAKNTQIYLFRGSSIR